MSEKTAPEIVAILVEQADGEDDWLRHTMDVINRWLARGDGVAIYRNAELGHPELGHRQIASFGSPAAQLETDEPPQTLPDIGSIINWRYQLEATYRGDRLSLGVTS